MTSELTWLKEARKARHMTTYEVAAKAGISQGYYSQIENGVRKATVPVAKRIAAVLLFHWVAFFPDAA